MTARSQAAEPRITGIEDQGAQRLLDLGPSAWAEAGGGDAQRGADWLEERWQAEEAAARDYADQREDLARKIAEAEGRLASETIAAADHAARREIDAERRRLCIGAVPTEVVAGRHVAGFLLHYARPELFPI